MIIDKIDSKNTDDYLSQSLPDYLAYLKVNLGKGLSNDEAQERLAYFGTEIVGTLIVVYGVFITPIGWEYALYIWLYALVWFFINDAIKMGVYKLLNNKVTL
jgi:hypothetical protein